MTAFRVLSRGDYRWWLGREHDAQRRDVAAHVERVERGYPEAAPHGLVMRPPCRITPEWPPSPVSPTGRYVVRPELRAALRVWHPTLEAAPRPTCPMCGAELQDDAVLHLGRKAAEGIRR